MGSRIQGLSGQHWWLYEPTGLCGSCSKVILADTVPACEYRGIPGWKIKWRIGWSVHSVCRLLGRVPIRLFIHELWLRCNNVLYIISIFYHTQSSLSDTIVFPQRSIARIVISARQSSVIHQIDWTRVEIFRKASVLLWITILLHLVYCTKNLVMRSKLGALSCTCVQIYNDSEPTLSCEVQFSEAVPVPVLLLVPLYPSSLFNQV